MYTHTHTHTSKLMPQGTKFTVLRHFSPVSRMQTELPKVLRPFCHRNHDRTKQVFFISCRHKLSCRRHATQSTMPTCRTASPGTSLLHAPRPEHRAYQPHLPGPHCYCLLTCFALGASLTSLVLVISTLHLSLHHHNPSAMLLPVFPSSSYIAEKTLSFPAKRSAFSSKLNLGTS